MTLDITHLLGYTLGYTDTTSTALLVRYTSQLQCQPVLVGE